MMARYVSAIDGATAVAGACILVLTTARCGAAVSRSAIKRAAAPCTVHWRGHEGPDDPSNDCCRERGGDLRAVADGLRARDEELSQGGICREKDGRKGNVSAESGRRAAVEACDAQSLDPTEGREGGGVGGALQLHLDLYHLHGVSDDHLAEAREGPRKHPVGKGKGAVAAAVRC